MNQACHSCLFSQQVTRKGTRAISRNVSGVLARNKLSQPSALPLFRKPQLARWGKELFQGFKRIFKMLYFCFFSNQKKLAMFETY